MARLTPEAAALRAFTVMPLSQDDVQCVLQFIACSQKLEGCDHEGDQRIEYAELLIQNWLALSLAPGRQPAASNRVPMRAAAYDSATLAYWLWSIEPRRGKSFCKGDDVSSGQCRVFQLIDKLLLSSLGMEETRPHRSTIEKINSAPDISASTSAQRLRQNHLRLAWSGPLVRAAESMNPAS